MKSTIAFLLMTAAACAATGDITSLTVRSDGWSGDLVVEGFTTGATYDFGLSTNNASTATAKMVLTVVSMGYDATGSATTISRTVYGTAAVRKAYPSQASKDETGGGNLTVRVSFSEPIFQKDQASGGSGTDILCTITSGLVTNSGGAGQTSASRTAFTVTNNSTLAYPKVIGKWAWPGFERQTGDFLVEAVCFHAFGQNGKPVACVKFDCADQHSNNATQQVVTSMAVTPRSGDAKTIWTYQATISVTSLTQADTLTCRFRAYPWLGDSSSVLDTDTGADGVAAPSESLSPLMAYLDKSNAKACYASVDGVGAGTPTVQATAALARTTPYSSLANAMTALKTYNNSTNSDNSLNNCYVLMQNGSYTGPGTFTGSNTKSWCVIQADTANGATESGVIFSTAANTACNAYLKFQDVSFTGSGAGMLRGSGTTGSCWIHSCTINNTSSSFQYAWRALYATQNTLTALTQKFASFSSNRGPWALIRGNDASGASVSISAQPYCILGNNRVISDANSWAETGNAAGNDTCDGGIVAWNQSLNTNDYFIGDQAKTTNLTKGFAVVGNLFERVTGNTTAATVFVGDNSNLNNANNVLFAHNTIAGQRTNLNYQEGGNVTVTRTNWYDRYNLFRDVNIKADTFANPQRSVSDASITNMSTTITSATANFIAGDVGQQISGTGLPNGTTTIASVTNGTTAVLSSAAVATASNVTIGIRGYIADPARVGNWAMLYGCGCRGSRYEINTFPRDFTGIDVAAVGSQSLGYTNDKSVAGATGGNGDYSLTTNSVGRSRVPSGMALIPGDFNGVSVDNSGRGLAGAIQVNFPAAGYGTLSGISPTTVLGF